MENRFRVTEHKKSRVGRRENKKKNNKFTEISTWQQPRAPAGNKHKEEEHRKQWRHHIIWDHRSVFLTFSIKSGFKDIPYKAPYLLSKSFTVLYIPPMILIWNVGILVVQKKTYPLHLDDLINWVPFWGQNIENRILIRLT